MKDNIETQKPTATPKPQIAPLRVDVIEAARIIGVSRRQLYRHVRAGKIDAVKDGSRTLFTMKELRAYIERSEKIL